VFSLSEGLDRFLPIGNASLRVAVLGIGNDLSGDDAVGVRIARELASRLGPQPDRLVLDAGTAPENFTAPLRRFRPDLVLLVDAAHLSLEPGSIGWVDWQDTDGLSGSTHTLPPSVLAGFLVKDLGCRLALLVIQPAHLEFDRPLSPAVEEAARTVVDALAAALGPRGTGDALS
jgi:hydrogenase 3 maturation protease